MPTNQPSGLSPIGPGTHPSPTCYVRSRTGPGSYRRQSSASAECLVWQILQIRQVLRPPAGRLVFPQAGQTDHRNHHFLNLNHLFFGVTRFELDSGNGGENLNPNRWHPMRTTLFRARNRSEVSPAAANPNSRRARSILAAFFGLTLTQISRSLVALI